LRSSLSAAAAGAAGAAAKDRMGSVICIKQMTRRKGRMRASRLLNLEFINLLYKSLSGSKADLM
jgi:hypothetical protein